MGRGLDANAPYMTAIDYNDRGNNGSCPSSATAPPKESDRPPPPRSQTPLGTSPRNSVRVADGLNGIRLGNGVSAPDVPKQSVATRKGAKTRKRNESFVFGAFAWLFATLFRN